MLVNDEHDASQGENHILHPSSRQLFRFWEATRAEKPAPRRDDLDLRRIRHLVPDLFIGEYAGDTGTFRWRLAGTGICRLFGRELTGTDMLAGWDSFEADVTSRFLRTTLIALQPCLLRFRVYIGEDEVTGAELAGFPLIAADGSTVHIFGGVFAFREPQRLDPTAVSRFELSAARTIWTEHLPQAVSAERPEKPAQRHFHVIPGGLSS